MYLVFFVGNTGSGIQVETTLFMKEKAAMTFMKNNYEQKRNARARLGIALPSETSKENEEYYTDISEREIRVYQAGETMQWEVVEIAPQDLPATLAEKPKEEQEFSADVYAAMHNDNMSAVLCNPALTPDEGVISAILSDRLMMDDQDEPEISKVHQVIPHTLVSQIQVEGIRNFLSGTFQIEPIGYAVTQCDCIGLEIERIDDERVFPSDEEAVEQAIKDGVKIIPVEELPENFDRRYLGWIDTSENRAAIQKYCDGLSSATKPTEKVKECKCPLCKKTRWGCLKPTKNLKLRPVSMK